MEPAETFMSQTELVLEVAVESAVCVLQQRLGPDGTDGEQRRHQLTAVLEGTAREVARKICRIFRALYAGVEKENQVLRDKVGRLESELRSEVERNATQTVYKIKPSDGPALSLDINQPAANPAALAMAILNSTRTRRRASSNPQCPWSSSASHFLLQSQARARAAPPPRNRRRNRITPPLTLMLTPLLRQTDLQTEVFRKPDLHDDQSPRCHLRRRDITSCD
ncbi:uncharacterized protein LOC119882489 [Micropterus salmoides]|uniref:uncharacterized protein LOC119882489 n=1 Tax=Micropterus salmoides TaxID=27706 RepID=UPI0018EE4504|nr:uncharacterized protein LOC119882489 [Micropterus salmoides]